MTTKLEYLTILTVMLESRGHTKGMGSGGMTINEIADELQLNRRTAHNYVNSNEAARMGIYPNYREYPRKYWLDVNQNALTSRLDGLVNDESSRVSESGIATGAPVGPANKYMDADAQQLHAKLSRMVESVIDVTADTRRTNSGFDEAAKSIALPQVLAVLESGASISAKCYAMFAYATQLLATESD